MIYRSKKYLHVNLRLKLDAIEQELNDLGFYCFESYRTPGRQRELYEQGRTKIATLGYHSFGLAVDYVKKTDKGNWSWDYWLNPTAPPSERIVKQEWKAMGQLFKSVGLIWGGTWGWDFPHAELQIMRLSDLQDGKLPIYGDSFWRSWITSNLTDLPRQSQS